MKTLTDVTSYTDYVEKLNSLFESDVIDDVETEEILYPAYSKEKFLGEVYMDAASYAKTDEDVYPENEYRMSGNRIEVRTLDLDLAFSGIKAQLDGIAEKYFGAHVGR